MKNPTTTPRGKLLRFMKWTILAILLLAVLIFPLPVRDADRERVIVRDGMRLVNAQSVYVDRARQPFYDAEMIAQGNSTWHFYTDLNLDLTPLEESGFRRVSEAESSTISWGDWYKKDNVLLEVTDQTSWPRDAPRGLRFNVHHGTMGAQGYVVYIHRCLLGTFAHYSIEWVS